MATFVKTFTWNASIESFGTAGTAGTGNYTAEWDSGNGDAGNGSLHAWCLGRRDDIQAEFLLEDVDWEDLGVPAGATVTDIQVTGISTYYGLVHDNVADDFGPVNVYVYAAGTTTHVGTGALFTRALSGSSDGSWQQSSGSSQAVGGSYQESTQLLDILITAEADSGNSGSAAAGTHVDDLDITITFDPPTIEDDFTADAIVEAVKSASFSTDAITRWVNADSYTSYAIAKGLTTDSVDVDAVVQSLIAVGLTADSIKQDTQTDTATIDAVLDNVKTQTGVGRLSLSPGKEPHQRKDHKIKVKASASGGQGTFRAAIYEGAANRSGTLESSNLTASMTQYYLDMSDVNAADITDYSDLEVRFWGYSDDGDNTTFVVRHICFQVPLGYDFIVQSLVQKVMSAGFSLGSVVSDTVADTITVDAIIQDTSAYSHVVDAVLERVQAAAFTADAAMLASMSGSADADAIVQATQETAFTIAAFLAIVVTDSVTADAIVQASPSGGYTADAIVQGSTTDTFTLDAEIALARTVIGRYRIGRDTLG